MVRIKEIRDVIVKGLYDYLGLIPIPIEDLQPKDEYPYITYNFINPYTPSRGQGNFSRVTVPSIDERFEFDIEETLEVQPTTTISINAYSKDKLEAQELALKIKDWFKHVGYQYLDDNNLVCVDVEAFGDRTVPIVDHHEHRVGMDILIRFTDIIERKIETIESFKVNTEVE